MAQGDGESSDEEITTKQPITESSSEPVSKSSPEAGEKGATSPKESSANSWWSTGSSWSGWYESALNKSSAAYDLMKKDLSEFKDTIANESVNYINSTSNVMSSTVQVVSSTASYLKETVESLVDEEKDENEGKDGEAQVEEKKSEEESNEEYHYPESLTIAAADKLTSVFNTLLESILPTGPADDPDEDCVLLPGNYLVPKTRWDQLVQSIQSDPITYCHEPTGPPDDYETWLEKFNLMDHQSSINYLLETSPTVADFYSQFVPKSLSSDEFWHRYFYRLHQLQEMEIQRAKLLYEKSAIKSEECVSKDVKAEDPKSGSEKVEEPITKKSESKSNAQVNLESKDVAKEVSTPKSSPKKTPVKVQSKLGQSSKAPSSASSVKSSASSVKSEKSDKRVPKVTGKTPSPASSESTVKSSSEGSEWEKTDLNEIVDEVAKKLGDKLNSMPEPRSDEEELDQWEFE